MELESSPAVGITGCEGGSQERPYAHTQTLQHMSNLVVDIGNSRVKAAVFTGGALEAKWTFPDAAACNLQMIYDSFPSIRHSALSSTRSGHDDIRRSLKERTHYFLDVVPGVDVPLRNCYSTPMTLGCDRLAAAVGAAGLFPERNLFIVDMGSAVTADIVSCEGSYMGGSISPGVAMRFRALNAHTDRLPLIEPSGWDEYDPGSVPDSTRAAIISGVVGGVEMELRGRMEDYGRRYPGLITIFTGGDAPLFEKRFKNAIFANYELVLCGLNIILNYNADKKESL